MITQKDLENIVIEEVEFVQERFMSAKFRKAIEAYQDLQLKQQQLQKAFVGTKDPKKREKLKKELVKMHYAVKKAEVEFNKALHVEPVEFEESVNLEINESTGIVQENYGKPYKKGEKIKTKDGFTLKVLKHVKGPSLPQDEYVLQYLDGKQKGKKFEMYHYMLHNRDLGRHPGYKPKGKSRGTRGLPEGKFNVGDIVIPNAGPHKGHKHEVIYDLGNDKYNIKPIGLRPNQIQYRLGASGASSNQLKLVKKGKGKPKYTTMDTSGMSKAQIAKALRSKRLEGIDEASEVDKLAGTIQKLMNKSKKDPAKTNQLQQARKAMNKGDVKTAKKIIGKYLKESTKAYGDALKAMEKEKQLAMLSKKDKETLMKLSALMKKHGMIKEVNVNPQLKKAIHKFVEKIAKKYDIPNSSVIYTIKAVLGESKLTEVKAMNMDTVPYNTIMKMKPGSTIKMKDGKIRTKDKFGNWRADTDPNDIIVNRDVVKHMKGMKGYNMGGGRIRIEGIVTEAKFKPGNMWSNDFDYDGMMKYASKVKPNVGLDTLQKLYNSLEDVNYHSENKFLGLAIDAMKAGDENQAAKQLKQFNKVSLKTLKSFKEGLNEVRRVNEDDDRTYDSYSYHGDNLVGGVTPAENFGDQYKGQMALMIVDVTSSIDRVFLVAPEKEFISKAGKMVKGDIKKAVANAKKRGYANIMIPKKIYDKFEDSGLGYKNLKKYKAAYKQTNALKGVTEDKLFPKKDKAKQDTIKK